MSHWHWLKFGVLRTSLHPVLMRSWCCVLLDSLRLSLLLFAFHLLSHLPFHSPDHLHLPCGGQEPCALLRMRTLASWPRTILWHASQFLQVIFRHHRLGSSSHQSIQFCFSRAQAHRLLCSWPSSTACAFASRWLTCPVAVCVHIHELWVSNDFDQALCTQESQDTLHVHLVTLCRRTDLSCCLFHAVHDVCSFLAHVQNTFHGCSVHCSCLVYEFNKRFCRRCSLDTRSHHWFCFFQAKNKWCHIGCTSVSLQPSTHELFAWSLCPEKKLDRSVAPSSHDAHHDVAWQVLDQSLKFTARAKQQSLINIHISAQPSSSVSSDSFGG